MRLSVQKLSKSLHWAKEKGEQESLLGRESVCFVVQVVLNWECGFVQLLWELKKLSEWQSVPAVASEISVVEASCVVPRVVVVVPSRDPKRL